MIYVHHELLFPTYSGLQQEKGTCLLPQATLALGSCLRWASSTASLIWSQILSGCPSPTDSDVNMKAPSSLREWSHKPSTGPFIVSHFSTSLLQGDNFKAECLPVVSFLSLSLFFPPPTNPTGRSWAESQGDDFCLSAYEHMRTG